MRRIEAERGVELSPCKLEPVVVGSNAIDCDGIAKDVVTIFLDQCANSAGLSRHFRENYFRKSTSGTSEPGLAEKR